MQPYQQPEPGGQPQPPYQQPSYQQPPYQQPSYQQPPLQQPSYQQPAVNDAPPSYLTTPPEARQALAAKATRDMVFGGLWLAFGLGITLVTYVALEGAAAVIAFGPALYGLYKIIKGGVTYARNT